MHRDKNQPGLLRSAFGGTTVDHYDLIGLLGLVLLSVGLGIWVSLGVALTAAGGLLLSLAIAMAVNAREAGDGSAA